VYHLPIGEAAQALDISTTVLKKYCHKYDIQRWPYGKLVSVDKLMGSITASQPDPELRQSYGNVMQELQECRWGVGGWCWWWECWCWWWRWECGCGCW
jgi:hypothetical protein